MNTMGNRTVTSSANDINSRKTLVRRILRHWQLYILFSIPFISIILFSYVPMYGIQIAFKNFNAVKGIWGSDWVGLDHFTTFFSTRQFARLIGNTLGISFYSLIAGFPIPIILAILLNECKTLRFKKTVQMITYAPHFISTVVLVSMLLLILAPKTGLVNNAIELLGGKRIDFLAKPNMFKSLYVWSGIWQGMGFGSIIYLSALSGVDPALYEAATIDGASKLQRIRHIDIPGIMPTIVITLILSTGQIMNVGYEKVLLMQNQLNISASDIISTYIYRIGLVQSQYSLSTAVGLFNSLANLFMLASVNAFARKYSETSLW